MLSIGNIQGTPSGAARYYASGDYYTKDGDEPSQWYGKGSALLGLEGSVSKSDLENTLSGKLPEGHSSSWEKTKAHHHPGWDLTFSAPKGISVMAIVGGDKRLIQAHEKAVDRALSFAETYAHIRVRGKDNKIFYRHTENIVAAKFTEFFSRALDPQLHTHTPVSNLTYDKERGKWYALDSKALYRMKMAIGQVYRNELAASAIKLGYDISRNARTGLFDIKFVPEELLTKFSQRRNQVKLYAEKHGWKSAIKMALATLLTRPAKAKTNHEKILADLLHRSKDHLLTLQNLLEHSKENTGLEKDPQNADQAANHGISHLTSREAVVEHGHIIQEALKVSIGEATIDDIEKALARMDGKHKYLQTDTQTGGKHLYHGRTTESATAWETRLAKHVLKQRETVRPLASQNAINLHLAKTNLTEEQAKAAAFVLGSRDRAVIVSGVAGSGKSHLVKAIKEGAPNRDFLALAPTATAAIDLGKSAGLQSSTLAAFFQTGGYGLNRNSVLFVDEASMSSTRQTIRLLDMVTERKARLVFLGDTKQFDAIEQGKPFALLKDMGLRDIFIGSSFRQKNSSMQRLVKAAREGKTNEVLSLLGPRMQAYDADELAEGVAAKWINDPRRDKVQIAALDNSTRIAANAHIRDHLKEQGKIGPNDTSFKILSSKALTTAQLSIADYYQTGDVVVFHLGNKALGIEKGEKYKVIDSKDGKVTLEHSGEGETIVFMPKKTRKKGLTLYSEQQRGLSIGDKVQWRHNMSNDDQIKNGHTGIIEKIKQDKATIKFDHGIRRTIDLKKHQYWDHGYVITSYKQQGKTTPISWVIANTEKAGEITQKSLYVSLTRAERSVAILTDNINRFVTAVRENPGGKTSSLESQNAKINLHQPSANHTLSAIEKQFDKLPARFRTPAMNLLDHIDELRSRRGHDSERQDAEIQEAIKAAREKSVSSEQAMTASKEQHHHQRER